VRAKLRLIVKRILRRYGYPPDKQEKATRTVLEQAELLSANWGVEPPVEIETIVRPTEYVIGETPLAAVAERVEAERHQLGQQEDDKTPRE